MNTGQAIDLINHLRVVPSFETPAEEYLRGLLDTARKQASAAEVTLFVKDPALAAPPLVTRVLTAYAAKQRPLNDWPQPSNGATPRYKIYWSLVRLMELDSDKWPGLTSTDFHCSSAEFEPASRQKRVWFGDDVP